MYLLCRHHNNCDQSASHHIDRSGPGEPISVQGAAGSCVSVLPVTVARMTVVQVELHSDAEVSEQGFGYFQDRIRL